MTVSASITHLLFIEHTDWPKLHDMFKACDTKAWQGEFPVGFPVRVCASNFLLINIFLDIVARIESRCMIKAKHVLLIYSIFHWKNSNIFLTEKFTNGALVTPPQACGAILQQLRQHRLAETMYDALWCWIITKNIYKHV